jgi:anthranilate phosphoribosyltransferase
VKQRRGEPRATDKPALAAWKLPLIVAALAVSIVGGFYLGGPGLGLAVGALAAASIIVMAVRHPPLYPIVPAPLTDLRRHVLVVVSAPLEDSAAIDKIAQAAGTGEGGQAEAEVLVLSPARIGFLDRWSSDFRRARHRAQRRLVVSVASLAKADVAASARVGDEDLVQAVEDTLRSFPATEVIVVTGSPGSDPAGNAAVPELESRLRADFHHLVLSPGDRP